jgi:hypothetical protein
VVLVADEVVVLEAVVETEVEEVEVEVLDVVEAIVELEETEQAPGGLFCFR